MSTKEQTNNKRAKSRKQSPDAQVEKEFDQKMVDLARVTRVMAGGKRMSFRVCLVIGDRQGRVGYSLAKGPDVQVAMNKAGRLAERSMRRVNLTEAGSIPHEVKVKYKSAKLLLKPAPAGTGVKAGGAVRVVLDLAGVKNVVAKQLGASNKINNVKAVFKALSLLKPPKAEKLKVKNQKAKIQLKS